MVSRQSNHMLTTGHCSLAVATLFFANHEMNLIDGADFITIDHSYVAVREVLQFGTPSGVGDFHPQNAFRKFQRPCPFCHRRSAGQRPRQQGSFIGRGLVQAVDDNFFQSGSNLFHESFKF